MNQNDTVIEKTGKTVDEAVSLALSDLGVSADRISYEVLEHPAKGLFGFIGTKPAKVRVTLIKADPVEDAKGFLKSIFETLGLKVDIETRKIDKKDESGAKNDSYKEMSYEKGSERGKSKDFILINLHGNNIGSLIGKHGQTLDSLQYLTNIVANKESQERVRIILDIEDYRKRREETLRRLALRLADKVKQYREKISLEPMNSQERKIVHMTLQNDNRIITYSEGDEPFRRVVIALKR